MAWPVFEGKPLINNLKIQKLSADAFFFSTELGGYQRTSLRMRRTSDVWQIYGSVKIITVTIALNYTDYCVFLLITAADANTYVGLGL